MLDKVPALDRTQIEDVLLGLCVSPAGESGPQHRPRRGACSPDWTTSRAATVNRYCSSSLHDDPHGCPRHQGGRRRRVPLRRRRDRQPLLQFGMADGGATEPDLRRGRGPHRARSGGEGGAPVWSPPAGLPDIYLAMGQTAENVAQFKNVGSRRSQDEFAVRSQNLAEESLDNGFWDSRDHPGRDPRRHVVTKDDGIRPGTTLEKVVEPGSSRFPSRRHRDRRQRLPAQRRRRSRAWS
ncbi:MAG: hypothetical protein V9E94_02445 [Microthrixaceae bacterium]